MILTISPRVRPDLHAEIRRVVRLGFWGVNHQRVTVDVRGRGKDYCYTGVCMPLLGDILLRVPYDPETHRKGRYPLRMRDRRLKEVPEVVFRCWREELLFLAAHEASHVKQQDRPWRVKAGQMFQIGSQSEKRANEWAARVLERQRPKL